MKEERRTFPNIILPLCSLREVNTRGDVGRPQFLRAKKMAVDSIFKEEKVSSLSVPIWTRTFAVMGEREQTHFLDTFVIRGVEAEVEF